MVEVCLAEEKVKLTFYNCCTKDTFIAILGFNGCFKFCQEKNLDEILHLEPSTTDSKITATVSSAISGQKVWSKISSQNRAQKFRDLIEYISSQKNAR